MGKIGSRRKESFMVQDSGVYGGGNKRRAKEAGLGWEYSPSEGRVRARTRRVRPGRGRPPSLRVDCCKHTLKAGFPRDWGSFGDQCRSAPAVIKPWDFTLVEEGPACLRECEGLPKVHHNPAALSNDQMYDEETRQLRSEVRRVAVRSYHHKHP